MSKTELIVLKRMRVRQVLDDIQDGKCAVCKVMANPYDLQIDHDHQTGLIRGLLCARCNNRLGSKTPQDFITLIMAPEHPNCSCYKCNEKIAFAKAAYIFLRTTPLRQDRLIEARCEFFDVDKYLERGDRVDDMG